MLIFQHIVLHLFAYEKYILHPDLGVIWILSDAWQKNKQNPKNNKNKLSKALYPGERVTRHKPLVLVNSLHVLC